ncbi:diacylglycerol kinase [Achromobacter sp. GG226]|uniref:diacylglycerol kinase n=1 Tax=Verticiella alkaliphila TaxID=2779529 RepID=UPI001C0AED6A|nr:diacylglycerol kinase [Verticiella sp. GG226]MBU4612255.1 diacylglycerol kinase [Verticiella sp. GG226]
MEPTSSPFKSVRGVRRVFNAWRYSMQGLAAATRHEAAFRQELLLAAVLVPAAFFVGRSLIEILLLLGTVFVVLIAELLNSALETLADAVSVEHHPLIGRAKDIGSAAVWLSLALLTLVWAAVLWDRFV